MLRVGNSLWWSQVRDIQEGSPGMTFKEAELHCFQRLYERMKDDGMKQMDIIAHFQETFDIKYTAFYTRLRRMVNKNVLS